MSDPLTITAVLGLVRGRDAAYQSISALARAIDIAEANSLTVQTVVVDATDDKEVCELLLQLDGITRLVSTPARDLRGAWQAGIEVVKGDVVWLGSDWSLAGENDLLDMTTQFDRSPDAAIVLSAEGDDRSFAILAGDMHYLRDLQIATPNPSLLTNDIASKVAFENRLVMRARPELRRVQGVGASQASIEVPHPDCFSIGHNSQLGTGTIVKVWSATERIEIGSYCSGSSDVKFLHPGPVDGLFYDSQGEEIHPHIRGRHRAASATTFPLGVLLPDAPYDELPQDRSWTSKPQIVGSDVWIGYSATILGGVSVGHGSIIGTAAVVTKDVPPYSVVGGNPAKVLRMRFSQPVVERLLKLSWWDWPEDEVLSNYQWFERPITEFLDHFHA